MTKDEKTTLESIATGRPFEVRPRLLKFLETVKVEETAKPEILRTRQQENAYHVLFRHIADALNEAGLSVQEVLAEATELDWTEYRVKEILWKKSLKKLYGKDSTTKMAKQKEIDNVYEHINRFLAKGFVKNDTGERVYIEYIPFPSDENRAMEELSGVRLGAHANKDKEDYDDMTEETSANKF